jgi:hypothetical protein
VATYMHLAIVISASEYKAASLRWWNAAWSLARELKLGKEVPVTPPPEPNDDDAQGELDMEHMNIRVDQAALEILPKNNAKSVAASGGFCTQWTGWYPPLSCVSRRH